MQDSVALLSPQLGNVVEVRISRPDSPVVFQRDRSDHEISLGKNVTSRSQATSELCGGTPIVPRQRYVMNSTQLGGNPICLLVPPKTEKNFRHNGPDQSHPVIVQQFIKGLLFPRLRAVEKRYPDTCIDQHKISHWNHWPSFPRPRVRASCRPCQHGPKAP